MVDIDSNALRNIIENAGKSIQDVSQEIGRGKSYISNCITRGRISPYALEILSEKLGVPKDDIKAKAKEAPEIKNEGTLETGYSIDLDVHPDKLRMTVLFNGTEIYHANAKIIGDKETDLFSAIRYAANVLYKLSVQEDLE